MVESGRTKTHKVTIDNRHGIAMTGITKVVSIENDLVMLVTEQGKLKILGKDMEANNLDLEKGILELTGRINSLSYSGDKESSLSLKGMFK
jgi:sporulation protein YabP